MDDRIAEIREAVALQDDVESAVLTLSGMDWLVDPIERAFDAARAYADLLDSDALIIRRDDVRDLVDPYVAETLYEEHLARNIEMRGGMASTSDWPAWDELPDAGREYWMGLAVAARLAGKAALLASSQGVVPQ